MTHIARRLPESIGGDFYVGDTYIDCDACRQIAPVVFRDHGHQSIQTRNEIRFRNYQKFGAEVKIIEDIDDEDEPPKKP